MSEEDLKLLQGVRDWRPPTKLHPMAMQAWHVYDAHGGKLPPEALAEIRAFLDAYGDDLKGLAEALEGLARFMILATENYGDTESGKKIADLMRTYTHLFEPFWQRVGEALQNVGAEARGFFNEFTDIDRSSDKTAPAFGEEPPQNSVPLRILAPPARPPAWARKSHGSR